MSGRVTQVKYAAKGKCQRCGKRKPASVTLCKLCLSGHNTVTRELKARLIAAGLCSNSCGEKRETALFCRECQDKHNARVRAWRLKRAASKQKLVVLRKAL